MATKSLDIIVGGKDHTGPVMAAVQAHLQSVEKTMTRVKEVAATAFAAFTAKLSLDGLEHLITVASEADKVSAQLDAVLRSTGEAAGLNRIAMDNLADGLKNVTTYSADAIEGSEALLATFTNIKGDNFKSAQSAVLDLSTALNQDLKSSSIQLGKALNDPIKGLTALQRVGVSFSASQKEVIKSMVETGDIAGAQKVILAEMNREFGGSAQAAAGTFGGQMKQISNIVDETEKSVGRALGSMLAPVMPLIKTGAETIGRFFEDMRGTIAGHMAGVTAALQQGAAWFRDNIAPIISATAHLIGTYYKTMADINREAMTKIVEAVGWVVSQFTGTLPTWANVRDTIVAVLKSVEFAISHWKDIITYAVLAVEVGVVTFANQIEYFFTEVVPGVVVWFSDNWRQIFTDMGNYTMTALTNIGKNISTFVSAVYNAIKGDSFDWEWTPLSDGFQSTLSKLPIIAERHIGTLEASLKAQLDAVGMELGEGLRQKLDTDGKPLIPDIQTDGSFDNIKKAADATMDGAKKIAWSIRNTVLNTIGRQMEHMGKVAQAHDENLKKLPAVIAKIEAPHLQESRFLTGVQAKFQDQAMAAEAIARQQRKEQLDEQKRQSDMLKQIQTNTTPTPPDDDDNDLF